MTQESLEKSQSITRLEEAAVQLYKALQAGKDTGKTAKRLSFLNTIGVTEMYRRRHGSHHGEITRIPDSQRAVLQETL